MKNNLLKAFFLLTFLFLDFVAFAQPGSTSELVDENNNTVDALESGDDAAVPINGKLLWLAIVGIAFAYYTYKKTRSVEVSN